MKQAGLTMPDAFHGGKWTRGRKLLVLILAVVGLSAVIPPQVANLLRLPHRQILSGGIPPDAARQFNYLKQYYDHLDTRTANRWDSQNDLNLILTEWPLFSNAFFVYSLRDMAEADPAFQPQAARYARLALQESMRRRSYGFIVRRYGNPLDRSNPLHNNALYLGHLNMMLGCYRQLSGDNQYDGLHHRISRALYSNVMASPTFSIESYPGECWPSDNAVVMASLALHDQLFGTNYKLASVAWASWMKHHLDRETGLFPALISMNDGQVFQGPRGVCLGFALPFIAEFDPDFALDQWTKIRASLYESRYGFGAMREYPRGNNTLGDIDTGPILFGVAPASSAFLLGGAKGSGDLKAFGEMLATGETVGWPVSHSGKKHYLLSVRVGDTVALWAKTRKPVAHLPSPGRPDTRGLYAVSMIFLLLYLWSIARIFSEMRSVMLAGRVWMGTAARQVDQLRRKLSDKRCRGRLRRRLERLLGTVETLGALGDRELRGIRAELDKRSMLTNGAGLLVAAAGYAALRFGVMPPVVYAVLLLLTFLVASMLDRAATTRALRETE